MDGMGGYSKYDFRGREGGSRLKGIHGMGWSDTRNKGTEEVKGIQV